MREIGIDLAAQRPKPLTDAMAQSACRIITMGCGAEACRVIPPEKLETWDLRDPSGGDIEPFRRVREAIRKKVEALLEQMNQ